MITQQEEKQESAQTKAKDRPQLNPGDFKEFTNEGEERGEIEGCSITPITFHSRRFFAEFSGYKDTFKYADQEVIRFSINAKLLSSLDIEKEGIKITRANETVASSKYQLQDAQKVKHHSLEKSLLQKAINHLLSNEICRTVLFDIFARLSGEIKMFQDDFPETHTVVLYKNPLVDGKHEITVIDPSNFLFSSHLSGKDLDITHDLLSQIITIHKGLKIYKPLDGNTGPKYDQFRDCIDIAVKIAFGLSQHEWIVIDSLSSIKEHPVIQNISNDTEIDKNIIIKTSPVRIKQASDIQVIKNFHEIEKVIYKNLLLISKTYPILRDQITESYLGILSADQPHTESIAKLLHCNEVLLKELSNELETEHTTLLGKIHEDI